MTAEVTETKKVTQAADDAESIVKLSKTYDFEGDKISELDFSGMENVTAEDMIKANKVLASSGTVSVLPGKRPALHPDHRSECDRVPD